MRKSDYWPVFVTLLALTGCGSGGSSGVGAGVGSTPTPSDYPKLTDATAATALSTNAVRFETRRLNNASTPTTSAQRSSVEISFDSISKSYTVRGIPASGGTTSVEQVFGPSNMIENSGTYDKTTSAGGTTTVSRLTAGTSISYQYTDFGIWTTGSSGGSDQIFNSIYFSYGVRTRASDMPRTGSANYTLDLVGGGTGAPITGSGQLQANFASQTVDVSLTPAYVYRAGPNGTSTIATLTGSGAITSSDSSFAAAISGGGYTGTVNGLFYGPAAAEVGGTFLITSPSSDVIAAGALLGKR